MIYRGGDSSRHAHAGRALRATRPARPCWACHGIACLALLLIAAAPVEVPPPSAKALRYHHTGNWLWLLSQVWGFAVPIILLWTGTSARLRDLAWKLGRRWFFAVAIYAALFIALNALIDLPLTYYLGFVRPHAYDLSNQTFAKWFGDASKRLAVGMTMGAMFLWVPYALMRRFPRGWWLATAALTLPLVIGLVIVKPVLFDPMFNDFGPMKDKALEARIIALAERAGIEGGDVYEVDKSRDTKTVNAYVTGLFGTKRIVLWDTLLARLEPDEVICVMGHEMGHYVLGHVFIGVFLSCLGNVVGLAFVHVMATRTLASKRLCARFGFDRLGDVASLPLLLVWGHVFVLATSPISLAFSRHFEHEADRFALELTRDNRACGTAFVKLQVENLSHPRPAAWYKLWRSTHPPIGERIDFSNAYRPWESGRAGRYEHLFLGDAGGLPGDLEARRAANSPPRTFPRPRRCRHPNHANRVARGAGGLRRRVVPSALTS